ncbi:RagB/SusD family nutrient uptake outer membrane protein [Gramella sp. AN32]|uniref:RagB/SusD family nutrient uptake outer membrane protein n=1 Tax=Christiangramia antarctica TaxID=2058158 RepID=A0ABW5X3G5_9FLAO|nr:RagB/SusD family nutrient uptake outer membrane protein [Gramella sp. AN32]MCM4155764.1 RagB/SusD family nutrient uptake outer membrane protein [Gramella sp. AN32]
MKTYRLISFLLYISLASSFIACEDQLEKSPLDEFDNATFWNSKENVELALSAVYRGNIVANAWGGGANDWWSGNGLLYLELASDNAYHGQGENLGWNRLSNGTLTAGGIGILSNYWDNGYRRVARTNNFLENVDKAPLESENLNRFIAEARFIRASQYFYFSQYFGSVPLVTKTLTQEEANNVSKASHQELVDFVIDELTVAIQDLPQFKDIPNSERGRASKQAALAFLGRIQLAEGYFADAANTYKTIIDFGDNIIDPDYQSLFIESNENSAENIFSIQFIPQLLANGFMQYNGPRVIGGYSFINPLGDLVESYQFTDGTEFSYNDPRYNPEDIGENRDPRLSYSIYYNGSTIRDGIQYISHPDSNSPDRIMRLNSKTGYSIRKYMDESITGDYYGANGADIPVIRYAEVLLSYLEAKLEAGDAIDQGLLDQTINQVRGRSSVNMPPVTETNSSLLRPILRNERRVELALEGLRYWDILRWGVGSEELVGDFYGHPYPDAETEIRKKDASAPEDPFSRWYVTTKNFREGIDNYWPIPQGEVNINPNLAD